jgi:hypothetical protein
MMRHRRRKNRKSPSPWDRAPIASWKYQGTSPLSQSMGMH